MGRATGKVKQTELTQKYSTRTENAQVVQIKYRYGLKDCGVEEYQKILSRVMAVCLMGSIFSSSGDRGYHVCGERGQKDLETFSHASDNIDLYSIPAEAVAKDGVPKGTVTSYHMDDCETYPGVQHDCWTYIPAQYDGAAPANLIVFTDGQG